MDVPILHSNTTFQTNGGSPDTQSQDVCHVRVGSDISGCLRRTFVLQIRAATQGPAKAIGWDDRIGSLAVGRAADVTVLR